MDAKEALSHYRAAVTALEAAESDVQTALRVVKEHANKSTLEVDGQSYQVRERGGRLYLCVRNVKPCGRPKGSKNRKTLEREAALAAQHLHLPFENTPSPDNDNAISGVYEAEESSWDGPGEDYDEHEHDNEQEQDEEPQPAAAHSA